jgi:hypothetical protein
MYEILAPNYFNLPLELDLEECFENFTISVFLETNLNFFMREMLLFCPFG